MGTCEISCALMGLDSGDESKLVNLLLPLDEPLESFEDVGSSKAGFEGLVGFSRFVLGAACGISGSVSETSPISSRWECGLFFFLSRLGVLLLNRRFCEEPERCACCRNEYAEAAAARAADERPACCTS